MIAANTIRLPIPLIFSAILFSAGVYGVLAGLVFLIQNAFGSAPRIQIQPATTSEVGASIFANFVLPFEVVSVLLLAALVGAVVIARRDERP